MELAAPASAELGVPTLHFVTMSQRRGILEVMLRLRKSKMRSRLLKGTGRVSTCALTGLRHRLFAEHATAQWPAHESPRRGVDAQSCPRRRAWPANPPIE